MKKALIFGVDGQDGSYLAELLLEKGYAVTGWVPIGIPVSEDNIVPLRERIAIVAGDLSSQSSLLETYPAEAWQSIAELVEFPWPSASASL